MSENKNSSDKKSKKDMKYCFYCGNKIPADATYCIYCGREFER